MPRIDRQTFERTARLARLRFDEAQAEAMLKDLASILDFVAQLEQVDTEGVPPTSHVAEWRAPLREDAAASDDEFSAEAVLARAPARDGDCFVVPRVLESEEEDPA